MSRTEQSGGARMHRRPELVRIRAALERSVHFRDLPPEDLSRIAALGRLRILRDGELARPRASRREFWIVLSGCLRVSSVTAQGKEFVHAFLGPGSFYGLGTVIRGVTPATDAHASGETGLAVLDGVEFLSLLDEKPRLWRHVSGLLHK